MKKLALLTTTALIGSLSAQANVKPFNGFYIGAGGGWSHNQMKTKVGQETENFSVSRFGVPVKDKNKSNDLFLSMYTGYGGNIENFYIGLELSGIVDFSKHKIKIIDNISYYYPDNPSHFLATVQYSRKVSINVAPRFGYVFDTHLIYIKPGIEITQSKLATSLTATSLSNGYTTSVFQPATNKTSIAFAPAIGYEKACDHLIFRIEYTYNFGKKISTHSGNKHLANFDNATYTEHRFLAGISYQI